MVWEPVPQFPAFQTLKGCGACRVMVWEPVPQFRAFLEYGLQLNHLMGLVDVHAAVIADKAGEQYEVVVPRSGVWGTAGIGGANVGCAATHSDAGGKR
jgi:hypothetical protein